MNMWSLNLSKGLFGGASSPLSITNIIKPLPSVTGRQKPFQEFFYFIYSLTSLLFFFPCEIHFYLVALDLLSFLKTHAERIFKTCELKYSKNDYSFWYCPPNGALTWMPHTLLLWLGWPMYGSITRAEFSELNLKNFRENVI